MGKDAAKTLERLTDLRRQFLEPLIAKHRGRVVKLMGHAHDLERKRFRLGDHSIRRQFVLYLIEAGRDGYR